MRIIRSRLPNIVGAAAICVWPFGLLLDPIVDVTSPYGRSLLLHEETHWKDQRFWGLVIPLVGVLIWYFLYLCILPVGWNPFRYHWEAKAMRAQGLRAPEIQWRLRQSPWRLWWM